MFICTHYHSFILGNKTIQNYTKRTSLCTPQNQVTLFVWGEGNYQPKKNYLSLDTFSLTKTAHKQNDINITFVLDLLRVSWTAHVEHATSLPNKK